MDSPLLQFLLPFLLITSFISINFELSLCADDSYYTNCSQPIDCGSSTNITYPFWGVNRPDYCGEPGFEVQCKNNIPVITSIDIDLRILGMTSTSPPTVKVARQDYWGTICPRSLHNTTLNSSLFSYPASGNSNVTFFYGCNISPGIPNQQPCNTSGTTNTSVYYFTQTSSLPTTVTCNSEVQVPVLEAGVQAIATGENITVAIDGGFQLGLEISNSQWTQCNSCEDSGGQCGIDTSNGGGFLCFCPDKPYAATCGSDSPAPPSTGSQKGSSSVLRDWLIGIFAGVFGTIIIIIGFICISRKRMVFFRKYKDNEFDVEAFIRNNGSLTPKRYNYSKVKKMTNSFKDKIGKGGYGVVYKGKLPDGLVVAVKVLIVSKGNGEDFINEVASIGRTSHVNVITLLGFCYERDKRALIYEYMPNGSLDNFIHNLGSSNANCRLEWETLSEIAVGIARGLEYLHRGCNTRILHFDIKPQNILLDNDFCPKISDFGLAKLCKTKESIVSMMGMRGTAGYIAPEVFSRNFGGVSHKSDVYSYGMLVLEMVGARKNLHSGVSRTSEMFPHYVFKDLELDKDENIFGTISEEEKERARKMILISMWCIQTNPSDRPSMRKVVEMLEGPVHSLPIPPKPFLFSPTRIVEESMTTSQTSETS